jgi:hypothetical protein
LLGIERVGDSGGNLALIMRDILSSDMPTARCAIALTADCFTCEVQHFGFVCTAALYAGAAIQTKVYLFLWLQSAISRVHYG